MTTPPEIPTGPVSPAVLALALDLRIRWLRELALEAPVIADRLVTLADGLAGIRDHLCRSERS